MRIHHQIVSWKSAIDGSFQVLGKGAFKAEALKKPIIGFNTFRDTFVGDRDRGSFLSLKMGCRGQNASRFDLYDLDSRWNFECKVARDIKGPIWTYEVERPEKESEFPDFRWRKRMEKYQ